MLRRARLPASLLPWPRRQLPALSPVAPRDLWEAVRAAAAGGDPREALAERLRWSHGAPHVRLCGSGTDALGLAIRAALREAGAGPVALPGFSCFDVATAAVGTGAPLLLYDLDPATLSPDLDSLARALARGARVVVASHLYGLPVEWAAVRRLAAQAGAVVVEDAAQGHGAAWEGHPLGSLGSLAVLSFGRGKGWTGGAGGALLSHGDVPETEGLAPAGVARGVSVLAKTLAQWALGRPDLYALPAGLPWLGLGETRYRDPGVPTGMPRLAAALALATREGAAREAAVRRANARFLREWLAGGGARLVSPVRSATPGYLRLPVRLPAGMASLSDPEGARRLGVERPYPSTLAALPAVAARRADAGAPLPGAETLVRELVTLPTHSGLAAADLEGIVRALRPLAARAADVAPSKARRRPAPTGLRLRSGPGLGPGPGLPTGPVPRAERKGDPAPARAGGLPAVVAATPVAGVPHNPSVP